MSGKFGPLVRIYADGGYTLDFSAATPEWFTDPTEIEPDSHGASTIGASNRAYLHERLDYAIDQFLGNKEKGNG